MCLSPPAARTSLASFIMAFVSSRAHYVCDYLVVSRRVELLSPRAIVINQVSCQTSLGSRHMVSKQLDFLFRQLADMCGRLALFQQQRAGG